MNGRPEGNVHERMQVRAWEKLSFCDPVSELRRFSELDELLSGVAIDPEVASLRRREQEDLLERRQAALFCHGMSTLLESPVRFAHLEEQDHDFVTYSDAVGFTPLQVKEVVPHRCNADASLEDVLRGLTKYADSMDLAVAIHHTRAGRIDLSTLQVPALRVREVWVFGALTPDQERWFLLGNLLDSPQRHEFDYP